MITLGHAASFSVLATTAIKNIGKSTLLGDVGVSERGVITGLPARMVGGKAYRTGPGTLARRDAQITYNQLRDLTPTQQLNRCPTTLKPGIYYAPSLSIRGRLTFDADGDPEAVFIFQVGSGLSIADSTVLDLKMGRVYFQVRGYVNIGVAATVSGTILAGSSITVRAGSIIRGSVIALGGPIVLNANMITADDIAQSFTSTNQVAETEPIEKEVPHKVCEPTEINPALAGIIDSAFLDRLKAECALLPNCKLCKPRQT